jgi:uncharacterized protein (TIGR03437 family)
MFQRIVFFSLLLGISLPGFSQIKIQSVVNAASFQPGMPNIGGLASIFVSGLTGTPGLVTAQSSSLLPSQLAGVSVAIDGISAPILAVYIPAPGQNVYGQINIQVPLEWNTAAAGAARSDLLVKQGGQYDDITPLPLSYPPWGGFFSDQNGYVIALHSDYSLVTTQNPARPGEAILAYADDFFRVWPPPPIAFPVPQQLLFTSTGTAPIGTGYLFLQDPPTVVPPNPIAGGPGGSCANTPAVQITFEGLAPGLIGVEQINFVVPANQQPGNWTLFFNTGTSADGRTCDTLHGSASSVLVKLPVR